MPSALYCSNGLVPLSLGGVVGGGVPSRKKNWMIGAILTTMTRTYAQCPILQPWSRTTELWGGGVAFQEEELDDWSYSNNNDEYLCPVPYIAAMVSYH